MGWVLALWVFAIGLACLLPQISEVARWDVSAVRHLSLHRQPAWTFFFKFLSAVGDTPGFLAALLGFSVFFFRKKGAKAALFFLVAAGFLKLSTALLKILIHRPRP